MLGGILNASAVLEKLPEETLEMSYWFCIFAVDEHHAICGDCWTCNHKEQWEENPAEHLKSNPCSLCRE